MSGVPGVLYQWNGTDWYAPGRANLPGAPVEPPPGSTSPIADAGSLPLGSALYTVPTANVVFVATNGSDAADGSLGTPVATLTRAAAVCPPGGTICYRGGSYNDGEDTQDSAYPFGVIINKSVTIMNYPGEVVWFDGSIPVAGSWTQVGSVWSTPYDRIVDRSPTSQPGVEDGWGAATGAGGWWTDPNVPQASWPDMVFYDGTLMEQVQTLGEVTAGKFFIEGAATGSGKWFRGTRLHIGSNPSGHAVRYTNKAKLATFTGTTSTSKIKGVGIRRYGSTVTSFGVLYMQHRMTLENVMVEDTAASFYFADGSPSTTFTKVTSRRVGFNFFGASRADDILLDRIDVQNCNAAGFNTFGPATGVMRTAKTQRTTMRNSIIKNNPCNGFWVDQTAATPIVVNTLFENNYRPCDLETASGGIVANCKFINNSGVAMFINDSDTSRLYNNTWSGNSWGVVGTGGARGVSTSTSVPLISIGQSPRRYDQSTYSYCIDPRLPSTYYTGSPEHQWTINKLELCNNVLARPGANTYAMVICNNAGDTTRPTRRFLVDMQLKVDGNLYHWSTKPLYPFAYGNGLNTAFTIFQTLAQAQNGSALDDNSTYVASDPLTGTDLHLSDSSLHAKAVALPADIASLVGQPAGTKHIGTFW